MLSCQVLRASGNFGVEEVHVVSPRCDVNEDTVSTVACASPTTLKVHTTLQDALADSTVSLAFSRRKGRGRQVLPSLSAFLDNQGLARGKLAGLKLALVFGREESGLEADEIMMCSHTVEIPSAPSFPSLNLSHAVAVILGQLYEFQYTYQQSAVDNTERSSDGRDALATHAEMSALYIRYVVKPTPRFVSECLTLRVLRQNNCSAGASGNRHDRESWGGRNRESRSKAQGAWALKKHAAQKPGESGRGEKHVRSVERTRGFHIPGPLKFSLHVVKPLK